MHPVRFAENPIIHPGMHPSIRDNINGPSLIRTPEWMKQRMGRYYLYFASHVGEYIRLAYADQLSGPWRLHVPGTLQLHQSHCIQHIASPDVHVDHARQEIRMYYHGPTERHGQRTKVASSTDGINFTARPEELGDSYFRVFRGRDYFYALVMPGQFLRSRDGLTNFEPGPRLFDQNMRHSAVLLRGNTLHVFYSNAGDSPERILLSRIELTSDWMQWTATAGETILQSEHEYEGADMPIAPSVRGLAKAPKHELRDPCIFEEDGQSYLLYSVAGENGIGIARLTDI
jgi:hypothetical protein